MLEWFFVPMFASSSWFLEGPHIWHGPSSHLARRQGTPGTLSFSQEYHQCDTIPYPSIGHMVFRKKFHQKPSKPWHTECFIIFI